MTITTMIGPALAALLALGGWMTAQTRDQNDLPRRGLVSLGQGMAGLGLLVGALTIPRALPPIAYAMTLASVLVVDLVLMRGAGRLAIGWTSAAEVVTSAVLLGWRQPTRAVWSLLTAAAGLALAAWLAGQGEPLGGLLGAGLALAPARWWLPAGAARERTRTGIEKALAGLLSGGLEWEGHEADLRGAPVKITFEGDATPARVSYPLPPSWKASSEENLEEDLRARLSRWGYWLTHVDASSRYAVAEAVEPLPTMLRYDGATATDRGEVVLGQARLSRQAARARGGRYGETLPFVWDARVAPHGLVVGTTGGGKSSTFRVIITSWCRNAGKRAILLDPKTTEFGLFSSRQGVMTVADTVESMTEALRQVEAERERRAALCKRHGVTAVWMLPEALRPPSWLVVIDEIMDFLDKSAAQTERAKAENELRAEAADLINRIDALARVGDIHLILAGQRLDRKVVDGRIQNNSPLRVLTGVAEAGSTERHMIGLQEVEPEIATPGRGVAKTVGLPECEVQLAYLDEDDLDGWLPKDDSASREWLSLIGGDAGSESERGTDPEPRSENSENGDDKKPVNEDRSGPERGSKKRRDRDDDQDGTEQQPPEPGNDRAPDVDDPDPDPEIDPLDFWEED